MSAIQWTDETWNWLVGCSRISPGCANCYAAGAAKSARLQQFPQYKAVGRWDGTVEFVESQLNKPLKRRKPTRYFTCSMSDVFHESVPFEWVDRAFAVMAMCPQHTFQVLTKRPERMLEYFNCTYRSGAIADKCRTEFDHIGFTSANLLPWPLPNVWLGATAESQEMANKRVPLLLQTPAAVRFLSCEPLLEEVNLTRVFDGAWYTDCLRGIGATDQKIDWVIVGGESGSRVRPFHLDWGRSLIKQCKAAGVPVFMKQVGSNAIAWSLYKPQRRWPNACASTSRNKTSQAQRRSPP